MAHSTKRGRAEGWNPDAFTTARLAADVTLQELADRIGVSRSTVYAWSEGRAPRRALIPFIAKALVVPQKRLTGSR